MQVCPYPGAEQQPSSSTMYSSYTSLPTETTTTYTTMASANVYSSEFSSTANAYPSASAPAMSQYSQAPSNSTTMSFSSLSYQDTPSYSLTPSTLGYSGMASPSSSAAPQQPTSISYSTEAASQQSTLNGYSFGAVSQQQQSSATNYTYSATTQQQPTTTSYSYASTPQQQTVTESYTYAAAPQQPSVMESYTYAAAPQQQPTTSSYTYAATTQQQPATNSYSDATTSQLQSTSNSYSYAVTPQQQPMASSYSYTATPSLSAATDSAGYQQPTSTIYTTAVSQQLSSGYQPNAGVSYTTEVTYQASAPAVLPQPSTTPDAGPISPPVTTYNALPQNSGTTQPNFTMTQGTSQMSETSPALPTQPTAQPSSTVSNMHQMPPTPLTITYTSNTPMLTTAAPVSVATLPFDPSTLVGASGNTFYTSSSFTLSPAAPTQPSAPATASAGVQLPGSTTTQQGSSQVTLFSLPSAPSTLQNASPSTMTIVQTQSTAPSASPTPSSSVILPYTSSTASTTPFTLLYNSVTPQPSAVPSAPRNPATIATTPTPSTLSPAPSGPPKYTTLSGAAAPSISTTLLNMSSNATFPVSLMNPTTLGPSFSSPSPAKSSPAPAAPLTTSAAPSSITLPSGLILSVPAQGSSVLTIPVAITQQFTSPSGLGISNSQGNLARTSATGGGPFVILSTLPIPVPTNSGATSIPSPSSTSPLPSAAQLISTSLSSSSPPISQPLGTAPSLSAKPSQGTTSVTSVSSTPYVVAPPQVPSKVPLGPSSLSHADEKKIIVVLGATGSQGGGLVRAILEDPSGPFRVRAITRDAKSQKAQELAKMGAEVVEASLDDPASLLAALQGAYGAFLVTFFWDHCSTEKEVAHAHALAKAAKDAGVKHVIWSTLEDTRAWVPLADPRMPTLRGKYKVPHFDCKAEGNKFFKDLEVPTTFLLVALYWDNLINFGMGPKRNADGKLVLALPMGDKKLAGIAADDIGRCAYGIFKKGSEYLGWTLGIAGEHLTGNEMAAALTAALGEEVTYTAVPHDDYRALGFPGAEDLGNMFQFYVEFEADVCRVRDVAHARHLNPKLRTFEQFLAENKDRIPMK